MSKQLFQSKNERLASLVEELKSKAANSGEDISAETAEYTAQLDELETVIDSLPAAGGIGDTLTWDGDMTGHVNVEIVDEVYLVKVSDSVPQSSDFVNGCQVSTDHTAIGEGILTEDYTAEEAIACFASNGVGAFPGDLVFIVPYAGNVSDQGFGEALFPEAGVYFMYFLFAEDEAFYTTSFTIPGYNFLPASSGGGTSVETCTVVLNGASSLDQISYTSVVDGIFVANSISSIGLYTTTLENVLCGSVIVLADRFSRYINYTNCETLISPDSADNRHIAISITAKSGETAVVTFSDSSGGN